MKRTALLLLSLILVFCLSACSGNAQGIAEPNSGSQSAEQEQITTGSENVDLPTEQDGNASNDMTDHSDVSTPVDNASDDQTESTAENGKKVLVAFFSRTGENYGVGVIEKGNTHMIADMIASEMDADTFEIARVTPYPEAYRDCTDEAQAEKAADARPELTAAVDNFDDYDVIFLGYPIWWGDMPMPVYTFLGSYDFSGKTVIPFCTHAGSGLSGTVQTLKNKLTGATVLDGLAIAGTTAQNSQDEAKQTVLDWLEKLDMKE